MVEFVLNGQTLSVPEGTTILQAAMQAGMEIPYFCYHPRLSIAGNCRMCLVEVESIGKPQASCMTQVRAGMVVKTQSGVARKAQEGAMEFLLLNHPLDCPICDQGGECDLQNIAFRYGRGESRSTCGKRSVTDKNMGPLIGTAMTRCIHCTRCIRFAKEIAGVSELDIQGRGEHAEIITYMNEAIKSPLSGNLADVCPVGALTNRPYGMQWRPWELTATPTIDVMDGYGSHIYVDTRGGQILRVRPRMCEDLNQDWLADHSRYTIDSLKHQRLTEPAVRNEKDLLEPTDWHAAVDQVADLFRTTPAEETAVLLGDLVDVETAVLLKHLLDQRGIQHRDSRVFPVSTQIRAHYTMPFMERLEAADVVVLVNLDLHQTAPLLNVRLRGKKIVLMDDIGTLAQAKTPLLLVDPSVYNNPDVCRDINVLMKKYPALGFGCVGRTAAHTGCLDVGFVPGEGGMNTHEILSNLDKVKLLFLVGFDDARLAQSKYSGAVVYMGHHYDVGAEIAHIVLPTKAYTEKVASYTNMMGIRQSTQVAVSGPEHARPDWHIIQALHQKLGEELLIQQASDIPYPQPFDSAWVPLPELEKSVLWVLPTSTDNVIKRHSPTWRSTGR